MSTVPLLSLEKFFQLDARFIGNEAAKTAWLYKLRLPLPETILIPSKTLKELLFFNKLEDKFLEQLDNTDWDNPHSIAASSKLLQRLIKKMLYPERLSRELISLYHHYFKSDFMTVKMSSLVKRETLVNNTHLNVKGDSNLLHSITAVWANHFSESLLEQRYSEIKKGQFAATTIIIQRLPQSESAGIAFTGDIVNLGKSIVSIYATWGIADQIDQMQSQDKFFVNPRNNIIILRDIAIKQRCYRRELDRAVWKKIPQKQQALPCLSDAKISEIAKHLLLVKRKTLDHVSLKWAVVKNKVYILGFTEPISTSKKVEIKHELAKDFKTIIKVGIELASKHKTAISDLNVDELIFRPSVETFDLLTQSKILEKSLQEFSNLQVKSKTPISFLLPSIRTVHEYLLLKTKLPHIPVIIEFSSPGPLLEIEQYGNYISDPVLLNLKSIDLCLKGIDKDDQNMSQLYSFDTQLMKQLLDRFFKSVHTFDKKMRLQVKLDKVDHYFLSYLSQQMIDLVLVNEKQSQFCRMQLFEIEKEQLLR